MQTQSIFGENSGEPTDAPPTERRSFLKVYLSFLRRFSPLILLLCAGLFFAALYYANEFWTHRYDSIIERQAAIYHLDPKLVWSVINTETYFQTSKIGGAGEVGLMQIMPSTAKDWARETGIKDFEAEMESNHVKLMSEPERNIQIGCWYLEKLAEKYRDSPAPEARILAAYNAGASRVAEWDKPGANGEILTEEEFINRIDITSTRAYVTEILRRYRYLQNK